MNKLIKIIALLCLPFISFLSISQENSVNKVLKGSFNTSVTCQKNVMGFTFITSNAERMKIARATFNYVTADTTTCTGVLINYGNNKDMDQRHQLFMTARHCAIKGYNGNVSLLTQINP